MSLLLKERRRNDLEDWRNLSHAAGRNCTFHRYSGHDIQVPDTYFCVRGKTIPAVETVRMTDEDGKFANNDKTCRPYDILNPEPSKAESKIIDRVIKAKPEKVRDVILEILRENR